MNYFRPQPTVKETILPLCGPLQLIYKYGATQKKGALKSVLSIVSENTSWSNTTMSHPQTLPGNACICLAMSGLCVMYYGHFLLTFSGYSVINWKYPCATELKVGPNVEGQSHLRFLKMLLPPILQNDQKRKMAFQCQFSQTGSTWS